MVARNYKFGLGTVILAGAIGYLMYSGVQQSAKYYFTVGEFMQRRDALLGQGVRVSGRVAEGSLRKQTSTKGTQMSFRIGDSGEGAAVQAVLTVPVAYIGVAPDMFGEGRDVIVEGEYVDGTLRAQTIMTSCPSKYEAEMERARLEGGQQAPLY